MVRDVLEQMHATAIDAGVELLIIVDHSGYGDKSRSRGASAKLDWPDVLWNQVRDDADNCTLTVNGRVERTTISFRLDAESGQLVTGEPKVKLASQFLAGFSRTEPRSISAVESQTGVTNGARHVKTLLDKGLLTCVKSQSGRQPALYVSESF